MDKHRIKLALLVLVVALSTVLTWALSYSRQPYTILYNAQLQGEIQLEFLSKNRPVLFENQYSLANLVDPTNKRNKRAEQHNNPDEPFLGEEYVVMDQRDSTILKVTAKPESRVVSHLDKFDYLLVDDNLTLEAQQSSTSLTKTPEQLDKIADFLGLPQDLKPQKAAKYGPVVVAVIDSGFYDPAAYPDYLAVNAEELAGQPGGDDDFNGYVDDVYGWSGLRDSGNVRDTNGHGTHLAGVIMAIAERLTVDGEEPAVKVLPVQVLDEQNQVVLSDLITGIEYAQKRGAKVINLSIGTSAKSEILYKLMTDLSEQDIIVVAAAGNYNSDQLLAPAVFEEVLAIGATNFEGNKAVYSNFGKDVDFSFRGDLISLGEEPDEPVFLAGTSQATAVASGIFANMYAYSPTDTVKLLKREQSIWHQATYPFSSNQLGLGMNLEKLFTLFGEISGVDPV